MFHSQFRQSAASSVVHLALLSIVLISCTSAPLILPDDSGDADVVVPIDGDQLTEPDAEGDGLRVVLSADPLSVLADDTSTAALTAQVSLAGGDPAAAGVRLELTTTLGRFQESGGPTQTTATDDAGVARATFVGGSTAGEATVTVAATSEDGTAEDTITIDVVPVDEVELPTPQVHLPLDEGDGQIIHAVGTVRTARCLWEPDVHLAEIPADEAAGMAEIRARVARMRAAGFNVFMPIVYSQYVDAVRAPDTYHSDTPPSDWDALGRYIEEARAAGMEIHLWYSPIMLKENFRANELVDHPEWCLAIDGHCIHNSSGVATQVELANDEARAWEVEAVRFIAERYHPDAVQLEEPYYHLGFADVPTNPAFTAKFRSRFGEYPPASGDWRVARVKDQIIDGLARQTRAALLSVDGAIALHVNVATSIEPIEGDRERSGLDPGSWVQSGWLDGWEPQIYGSSVSWFAERLDDWQDWRPGGSPHSFRTHVTLIPGIELYFHGFDDENTNALRQILIAEQGGSGASAGSGSAAFSYIPEALAEVEAGLADNLPAPLQGTLGSSSDVEGASDPTWVAGPEGGNAVRFDGNADFVRVPGAYAFDEYGSFTFASRVRLEPGERRSLETFVSRGSWSLDSGYVWIYSRGDSRVWYEIADGEANTSRPFMSDEMPTLYDGEWHWLVVTQDRAAHTITFYLDGIPSGEHIYEGWSRPVVQGAFYLGAYAGSSDTRYSLHGDLADVRWYRRTLTAEQVEHLARHGDSP